MPANGYMGLRWFLILVVFMPSCLEARTIVNVFNAKELYDAIDDFSKHGDDAVVYIASNISFAGYDTRSWPVGNLSRGTVTLRPSPDVQAQGQQVFLDAAG